MVAPAMVSELLERSQLVLGQAARSPSQLPLAQAVAEEAGPLIQRLSPINQLRVIMGLFVIVILGIFLFIVIKAGSHMVRGMSAKANRLPASSLPEENDWAKKKLNEEIPAAHVEPTREDA